MIVSGTGISSPFVIKIKDTFIPKTVFALKWVQTSDGKWHCVDRGYLEDDYDAEIELYKDEDTINYFIEKIEANRTANSNVIQLSGFNSQEKIFGAEIDYTGALNATVFMNRRRQGSWKGFGVSLKLSVLSPSFVGGDGFLPTLRFLNYGYDADANYTINKFKSYRDVYSYQDHQSDDGSFVGDFVFTDDEMIGLRRFVATNRGAAFEMPEISGVKYPFGSRMPVAPGGMVKLIAFEDLGMVNVVTGQSRWGAKLTLASYEEPA